MVDFTNEPETDFTHEKNRSAFKQALAEVSRQLGRRYPAFVGGRPVETGEWMPSTNPSRPGELVGEVARSGAAQADAAVSAAQEAFIGWAETPAEERASLLFRAAQSMRERRFELAAWEVYEVGKPWREADADVAEAIDYCEYYGREAIRLGAPRPMISPPGERNQLRYLPRGVAAVIAPWNFPLAILTGMSTAALAAGNTVVLKPAEQSAVIGAKLAEIIDTAGFPAGAVNYLPGEGEVVGEQLVRDSRVAVIAFTGSLAVGNRINSLAAELAAGQRAIKRVILEMGGKNAIIVDDDADLDEAVVGVIHSAFGYSGQKCSACSRVVTVGEIGRPFTERLVEAARSLAVGLPEDPGTQMGPLIDQAALEKSNRYLEIGRREAHLLLEPTVPPRLKEGYFVGPAVFDQVSLDSPLAQEEIFGPVLSILRADDFAQALEAATGTLYALTGGVYSRSPDHLELAWRRFRVGNLYLNRPITGAKVGRQPFGGIGLSGIGSKAGGPDYLLQFMEAMAVSENTMRRGFAPEPMLEGVPSLQE